MNVKRVMAPVTIAVLMAGCGGERISELERQSKRNEERLVRLEGMQKEILDSIEASRREAAASLEKRVEELVAKKFDERIQGEIVKKIDEKMGGGQQLQAVIKTAVDSAIAQNEAQKEAAEEARNEERRQQWEQRRQESENRRWTTLQQDLKLNDAQLAKMREASDAVRDQIRQGFEAMRERPGEFNMEQARQQGEQLRQQYEAALGSVLSAEQLEAYRQRPDSMLRMMSGMLDGGRRGPPGGGFGGPGGGPPPP